MSLLLPLQALAPELLNQVLVQLALDGAVHARLGLFRQLSVRDKLPGVGGRRGEGVGDAQVDDLRARQLAGLEGEVAQHGGGGELVPEEAGHGRGQRQAVGELGEAEEAARGGGEAVVVRHGEHEAGGVAVTVHEGDGGHGVCQKSHPEAIVKGKKDFFIGQRVFEIEAVGVVLGNGRRGDDDAGRIVAVLENVERREQRLAKGRCEAVVGRRIPRQQVDLGLGLGACERAAGVLAAGADGEFEERRRGGHDVVACVMREGGIEESG